MKKRVVADLFRNFGKLLNSGMPLVKTLKECSEHSYMKEHKEMMEELIKEVCSGKVLSSCLAQFKFPKEYVDIIKAGEINGKLDFVSQELADIIEKEIRNGSDDLQIDINVRSLASNYDLDKKIIEFVNNIFLEAIEQNASDIHIIPYTEDIKIKFRINGLLQEYKTIDKDMYIKIIGRIKIMSCLDIAEKRLPQDGRIKIKVDNNDVDLRVCVVPAVLGEKITIRILKKSNIVIDIKRLQFSEDDKISIKKMMNNPFGLIVVTGSTGSGKTTTLYSLVNEYLKRDLSIVSIEEPVEYIIEGVTQIPVRKHIGLSFPAAIRSALRSDPDVICIGEMQDKETIELAIKAAQTGHIVLCQFHTRGITNFVNMMFNLEGIDNSVFSSILTGVISQVLVRRLCDCKKEVKLSKNISKKLNINKAYDSVGCEKCLNTGYRGRKAVYEMLIPSHELKKAFLKKDSSKINKYIKSSLLDNAFKLIENGETSIEEIERVFGTLSND